MSAPNNESWSKSKRLAKYLAGRRGCARKRARGCWRCVRLLLVANGNSPTGPRASKVEHFATWERGTWTAARIGHCVHAAGDGGRSSAVLACR